MEDSWKIIERITIPAPEAEIAPYLKDSIVARQDHYIEEMLFRVEGDECQCEICTEYRKPLLVEAVKTKIRELASIVRPSETVLKDIFSGWEQMFLHLRIPPHRQEAEFDAIMKARVRAGCISVLAG